MEPTHDLPPLEAEPAQSRGGTIIRVKRKRNEQPLDALVIVGMMPPSKRAAFDALSAAFATLSTKATTGAPAQPASAEQAAQPTRRLYRLAHTVKSTKEAETKTALDRIEDIKQKRKRTIEVSKEEKSKQVVQQKHEQTRTARLKVVERHRTKAGTIVDVAVERESGTETATKMPPPVYIKPAAKAVTTRKLPSARRQGARFTPNLAAAKTQEQVHESELRKKQQASPFAEISDETTFSQYLPMVKSYLAEIKGKEKLDDDDEYEYDLYYFDDTADKAELDRDYGVVHIESFDEELVAGNEYDESEEEYDSEDSNDENNPNYEYPEESEPDSDGEEEGVSDLSSDDEESLVTMHWRQLQREEYSKFDESMGDLEDGGDDDALDDDDDDNGAVPPPMIQPDFAFFQNWRAMRK